MKRKREQTRGRDGTTIRVGDLVEMRRAEVGTVVEIWPNGRVLVKWAPFVTERVRWPSVTTDIESYKVKPVDVVSALGSLEVGDEG